MSFSVNIEDLRDGVKVVHPHGRLDTATHPILDTALEPVLAAFQGTLVFDMTDLDFISSAGLSVLFKARKAMAKAGGKIVVAKVQPQIKKVFDVVKAMPDASVFESFHEVDEYLAMVQQRELDKKFPLPGN